MEFIRCPCSNGNSTRFQSLPCISPVLENLVKNWLEPLENSCWIVDLGGHRFLYLALFGGQIMNPDLRHFLPSAHASRIITSISSMT